MKIYHTKAYNIFKNIIGNRGLNQSKIKRIIKDISSGTDMLKYCPIIVDNNMRVIDGQHRLSVAKKLHSDIYYVIINDKVSLYQIARMNSATERWNGGDFLKCYIETGSKDYKILDAFVQKYKFNINTSVALLSKGTPTYGGDEMKNLFESGAFKVKELEKAEKIADLVIRFSSFHYHNSREFIRAIYKLMNANKCDFNRLVKNFKEGEKMLDGPATYKQYIVKLEEIYNRKKTKRDVIF